VLLLDMPAREGTRAGRPEHTYLEVTLTTFTPDEQTTNSAADDGPDDPMARACKGCSAEPGEPCAWGCLSHVTDEAGQPIEGR
jgi:hypothetical protein